VKSQKEARYHLRRSSDLVVRLGDGTEESHALVRTAADGLWAYTGEVFVGDPVDVEMVASGEGFDPAPLKTEWQRYLAQVLDEATLRAPAADAWMQRGRKQGVHTEHLSYLLAEMQVLHRAHPGATWEGGRHERGAGDNTAKRGAGLGLARRGV
jgi:ring-1,2-phenylacetyl-CoA epoxidase subunit PaaC